MVKESGNKFNYGSRKNISCNIPAGIGIELILEMNIDGLILINN